MKFGLDTNIVYPPLSAVYSILLIFGCDFLGFHTLKLFQSSLGQIKNTWIRWQAPLMGALLLSIVLYPLVLFGFTSRTFMKSVAFLFIVFGLIDIFFFLRENINKVTFSNFYKNLFKKKEYTRDKVTHSNLESERGFAYREDSLIRFFKIKYLFVKTKFDLFEKNKLLDLFITLLMIGYGFLSLGPVTNADSLDYHIGVAIEILNQGKMPVFPGWFHGRLAGNGEVLNAFGLSLGAEQFGPLLQFCGLLGIYGILAFYTFSKTISENDETWRKIIVLAFLSSPVLVFLVSSPKPQLLQIGMTSFAVVLLLEIGSKVKSDKNKLSIFSLICMLILSVTQAKFSFFLSAFLIGFFSIILLGSARLFIYGTLIGIFFFVLIIFPSAFWKMENFNSSIVDAIVSPLPGSWPGTTLFESALRNYRDSTLSFPMSLVIPNTFGVITTVIGFGLFLIIFIKPNASLQTLVLSAMAVIFVIFGSLMGQKASRFFLEPFIWVLISLVGLNSFKIWNTGFVKEAVSLGIVLQTLITFGILLFGIYQLFPGTFSIQLREKVMNQNANGYDLMKWVDAVLPKDAVLLSQHRSIALSQRKTLSLDWSKFVDFNSADANTYLKQIKNENVTHILILGDTIKNTPFSDCLGNPIGSIHSSRHATRNPFGQKDFFTAMLVEFQSGKLPQCANSTL
ncbi:PF07220 family protein [Leptospira weilii serovar Ranarum str. ICFT]|uniref:PF07220 family protein n=1 Tax=Leptospira weilii serovar Ranarum str. ICFT TaxID=1218598 RepID=N1W7P7_9LEPT|nr:DUF1420 family protein [Leptospira weilii]EMY76246.1 PF07220 family protein [Leptospira weilii serovar Ranarum str. ICFT]